eukprot:scaffold357952_cov17-Prasinocladus_malaysianus.AAC.1
MSACLRLLAPIELRLKRQTRGNQFDAISLIERRIRKPGTAKELLRLYEQIWAQADVAKQVGRDVLILEHCGPRLARPNDMRANKVLVNV